MHSLSLSLCLCSGRLDLDASDCTPHHVRSPALVFGACSIGALRLPRGPSYRRTPNPCSLSRAHTAYLF